MELSELCSKPFLKPSKRTLSITVFYKREGDMMWRGGKFFFFYYLTGQFPLVPFRRNDRIVLCCVCIRPAGYLDHVLILYCCVQDNACSITITRSAVENTIRVVGNGFSTELSMKISVFYFLLFSKIEYLLLSSFSCAPCTETSVQTRSQICT
jgi:hypothetical protein